MNIAYLAPSPIPSTAANAVHVMRMAAGLAAEGHEVTVLAPGLGRPKPEKDEDVFAYYGLEPTFAFQTVPRPDQRGNRLLYLWATWTYNRRLARRLKKLGPDLVYARHLPGAWAAARAGFPVVYEAHQTVWDSRLERSFLDKLAASDRLHRLVVISRALKVLFLQHTKVPAERILVLPDAADAPPDQTRPEPWPGRADALQLGYVGSLHAGRGVGLLLELARRLPEADLHLVGGDEAGLARVRGLNPPGNVHLHGHVPPARVHCFRNACDLLLAPYQQSVSVHGGAGDTAAFCSPLKIFEYLASGRPMVVSDLPVFREVLDESVCLLAPPEDANAWEVAVRSLLDESARQDLARAALERFEREHTWQVRAERALDGIDLD